MHQEESAALFGESFGRKLRTAREQKGWSQRELAAALQTRGVKLDPSAVTRIERGTREVKLREAATMADCLNVDLNELLTPQIGDPLSRALQLRKQAGACLRAAWIALAQLGMQVQALTDFLDKSPPTADNLSSLRGRPEGLDLREVVGFELHSLLHELQQWIDDAEVPIDERVVDELQRTVVGAVDELFTAKSALETLRRVRLPTNWRGDATT